MNSQKPRESGGWLGGFVLFVGFVAFILLAQIPAVSAVLGWIFTTAVSFALGIYLVGVVIMALVGFGEWFGKNPLTAFLKMIFWPIAGLLLLFQKAN